MSDMVESGLVQIGKNGRHYDRFRERLMFPIMDIEGHVVGFGGRAVGQDEPKYLNSPNTPLFDKSRQLYGIHAARKGRHKEIIIAEGYMDVLSIHQAGYSQAVGVLGTALTALHARLLKRINANGVILLFDNDAAGEKALLRAIPILLDAGLTVKCLQVTGDAKDPDEYIQKYGPDAFGQLLKTAESHVAFRLSLLSRQHDLKNTEGRINFTQKAAEILASIDSAIEADAYIRDMSKLTGIAHGAISSEMDKQRLHLSRSGAAAFSMAPIPRDRQGLRYALNGRQQNRGVIDAQKGLLSILLTNPGLNEKIKSHLTPEEMGDHVTSRLLETVYQQNSKSAADIITQFETLEEQRKVAEILKDSPYFDDIEKAINEMLFVIKRAYVDTQFEQKGGEIDTNAINTLIEAKRNLEKQYITITNG